MGWLPATTFCQALSLATKAQSHQSPFLPSDKPQALFSVRLSQLMVYDKNLQCSQPQRMPSALILRPPEMGMEWGHDGAASVSVEMEMLAPPDLGSASHPMALTLSQPDGEAQAESWVSLRAPR